VLVTDGAAPVRAFTRGGEIRAEVPPVEVVDTVGAGDSFGGAFLAWWAGHRLGRPELGETDTVRAAAQAAADAAALTCTRRGAQPPWARELAGHAGWDWLPQTAES
jgi:fructokinase